MLQPNKEKKNGITSDLIVNREISNKKDLSSFENFRYYSYRIFKAPKSLKYLSDCVHQSLIQRFKLLSRNFSLKNQYTFYSWLFHKCSKTDFKRNSRTYLRIFSVKCHVALLVRLQGLSTS